MYCTKCGTPHEAEDNFCKQCGNRLAKSTDVLKENESFEISELHDTKAKSKKTTALYNQEKPKKRLVRPSFLIVFSILLIFIFLIFFIISREEEEHKIKPTPKGEVFQNIEISVETSPELFPVIQKYLAQEGKYGDVIWRLTNPSNSVRTVTVTSQIKNWTDPVSKTVNLKPKETITFDQVSFSEKLLHNQLTNTPASLHLTVKEGEKVIFDETRQVQIRNVEDMIWSTGEKEFDLAFLIASWVTPRDPLVESIISKAKNRMKNKKFTGYQGRTILEIKKSVLEQMRAIFDELRDYGVSYVSSTITFGIAKESQRVRLPKTSIRDKQANCIDISVLLASCYENIGLETDIVLIPGHAFLGVKTLPDGNEYFFIDATNIGRDKKESIIDSIINFDIITTFDAALKNGNNLFKKYKESDEIYFIDIKKCREMGIKPLF